MVLRSGIIIPFQFRDNKKLLTIGVPEEERDLNIWDLKNVVRSAFGIYNFEFRNKKIGFNIPDDLLLNYLAQRHDLTNFVIEVVQAYELSTNNCISCRCLPLQKPSDDSTATSAKENQQSNQRRLRHSSSSNNDSPVAEPAYKVRRQTQNSSEITVHNFADPAQSDGEIAAETEFSHLQMEHKFDYDSASNEDEAVSSVPSASGFHNDTSSSKVSFERIQMHHDYYMQQQQQQQHQQQQQLQHHMEMLMQERTSSGITLRQRKERMSRKQKEVYVNFLEQTPVMSEYKRNDPFLDVYWQKLTDILNSVPQGAIKTVNEWKQAFDNWRFRIYLYARYNSKITGDDVLNSKNFKPLTMTDKRAYALWIRNADTAPPDLDKMRNIFVNIDEAPPE